MSLNKYSARKVSDRVFSAIESLVSLKMLAEQLVAEAAEGDSEKMVGTVEQLEGVFASFQDESEAIKNSIVTLGRDITGANDESEEAEIDVIPTENGFKF